MVYSSLLRVAKTLGLKDLGCFLYRKTLKFYKWGLQYLVEMGERCQHELHRNECESCTKWSQVTEHFSHTKPATPWERLS